MTKDELIQLVGGRLGQVEGGLDFQVISDGVRQDGEWWYIPVVATRRGLDLPREFTINIFASLETELEENHNLNVLFVPAVA